MEKKEPYMALSGTKGLRMGPRGALINKKISGLESLRGALINMKKSENLKRRAY